MAEVYEWFLAHDPGEETRLKGGLHAAFYRGRAFDLRTTYLPTSLAYAAWAAGRDLRYRDLAKGRTVVVAKKHRASYRAGIAWIAGNDDIQWLDGEEVIPSVTACMLADLFGATTDDVTNDLREFIGKTK